MHLTRGLYLPDRRLVLPRPGLGGPAGGPRPGRLGRLLAGRAAFTYGDVGGCNCPGGCGYPCAFPAASMTLTEVSTPGIGSGNGSATLGYTASGFGQVTTFSGSLWRGCFFDGVRWWFIEIMCNSSCTYYYFGLTNSTCTFFPGNNYDYYQHPTNCAFLPSSLPGAGNLLTLSSSTCSPLNVVFTYSFSGLSRTWTLTP